MKRTVTLFLMSAIASCALAQTPKVVEKTVTPVKDAAAAHTKQVAAVSTQSPAPQVKVIAVPAAKPSAAVSKAAVQPAQKPAPKPAVIAVQPAPKTNSAAAKPAATATKTPAPAKPVSVAVVPAKAPASGHVAVVKAEPAKQTANKVPPAAPKANDPFNKKKAEPVAKVAPAATQKSLMPKGNVVAVNENKTAAEKKPEEKKITAVGRRDPFVSPVVHMSATGSGCSSGKRCLAIDQIALKGVVRSENGMIAVVVNSMSKAYFLRENDPVFNGYVTKITADSVTFKETFHDKLGKELTRDVVKSISRPAA